MIQDFELVRGSTLPLELELTDANGRPYTLAAEEYLVFGVKKNKSDADCLFTKMLKATKENGVYSCEIDPEDTENLAPGYYHYDIALESGGDFYTVIEPSTLAIMGNVTKRSDVQA